ANGMTRQRPLAEEVSRPQHRHDRLLAAARQHRELDRALLNVQDGVGRITLGENEISGSIGCDCFSRPGRTEKLLHVEARLLPGLHDRLETLFIIAPAADGVYYRTSGGRRCGEFDQTFTTAGPGS